MNLAARESPLRVGSVVADKYRVVKELGRGGMGTVYEAVHTGIGKHVALKFLEGEIERDTRSKARFLREAQTASLVESPHVVHIFDSGCTDDGTPFMVLELLRGEDLRARLRREGRLPVEQAVTITVQTLRALVRTHAAGIVHRDLKPENIFLCAQDDASILVKLLDFGISKVTRPEATLDTLTHEGTVLGTAFYMSPEQARGESDLDGRSDLYGLGAIFYEMLAGRTPHVGSVYHAVLVDICTRDADDVRLLAPQVPEPIAAIVARALGRDKLARFADAQAFLDALAPYSSVQLSSGEGPAESLKTRVSQPSVSTSTEIANVKANTRQTRLARIVASLLLFAIVGAAVLIVVVHKRFKAQQAERNAALHRLMSLDDAARRASAANAVRAQFAPATSSALIPSAAASASVAASRRNPDAGSGPRRVPPRSSAVVTDELQLKTTMP